LERSRSLFRAHFACEPVAAASAPGRVNLIGEHTDYNDGFVLPMAIEQRTAVAIGRSEDAHWRFVSEIDSRVTRLPDDEAMNPQPRDWTSYCRGVAAGFRAAGHAIEPLCVAVASDVPTGGGLSSSAALEVAMASALEGLLGERLDPVDKALLCQRAEHEFANVPCGYMDQAISVMAVPDHALLIDCRSRATRHVRVSDGSACVLIINSMVRHELAGSEYAVRRAQCARAVEALQRAGMPVSSLRDATREMLASPALDCPDIIRARAQHVISENARTTKAADLLEQKAYAQFGRLMVESHASLRDDYEVSCDELDYLVDCACDTPGVFGARMTGGGFGGCAVALVESAAASRVGAHVAHQYRQHTGMQPDWFVTAPGGGARVEFPLQ